MIFKIDENTDWIRVFINDTLHLMVNKKFVGMQSWKYEKEYCIEFHYENTSIFCSYDKREIWEEILKLLSDRLFPVR